MTWDRLPVLPTFERARRREIYRKLAGIVKREPSDDLLSLDTVKRRLRIFDQRYIGIEPIPVTNIVGSADRNSKFTRDFLPKDFETRERWRRVEQAFPLGDFPPIVVYQMGDVYFVVDGHHRVAVAKQRDVEFIDAEITELKTDQPLGADVDIAEIIHREQQTIFMEESGLQRSRPQARIEFSRPLGYVELLELVQAHGYHLMIERDEVLGPDEVAADWYDHVYLPALDALTSEGLRDAFSDATDADLFLWIYQRRQALFPEHGRMSLEETVRRVRDPDDS
ncbi:MAG: hypothetical protein M3277_02235 [Actinomycetota bacterium]|nr:hypothetical protein [Actinomycetota bacterium]